MGQLGDPFFLHFVGVALLAMNEDGIIRSDRATLPAVVSTLGFDSDDDVRDTLL